MSCYFYFFIQWYIFFYSLGTKQTIIDLEFINSIYKDEEIAQYKEKTKFMMESNIRQDGCNLFSPSSDDYDLDTSNDNVIDKD